MRDVTSRDERMVLHLIGCGRKVREARQAKGMRVEQVCAEAGVGAGTLLGVERGTIAIRIDNLIAICRVLGLSLSAFDPPPEADRAA